MTKMPWIEHTNPNESHMPKYQFGDADNREWVLVPAGDYPFEITSVEFGIRSGGKTNGSETMSLRVRVFADNTFVKPLAEWTEELIFHPNCAWRIDTFVKCASLMVNGKAPSKDQEIEFTPETVVGLRGWAVVGQRGYKRKDGTDGKANEVVTWLTNKAKVARNAAPPPPKAAEPEDNLPF